jgi:hypothetical protein
MNGDAHAWIAHEVDHGQFKRAIDDPMSRSSGQITAARPDAFAKAHPLVVGQQKAARLW